jgi:CRP-like cAMP-binding protein
MYNKVAAYIHNKISINGEELKKALEYFEPRTFEKGEYLLRIGKYSRFLGFLNKGLVMTTITDENGNEKASNFIYEGCFFTCTEGLTSDIPSSRNIIALEPCETLILSKENLADIFKLHPKFETLLNQMLAEELRKLLLNEQESKPVSLEEKYINLEKQYPNAFQRIPLKHIAGYLGIEAQSISRLRKRLAEKTALNLG